MNHLNKPIASNYCCYLLRSKHHQNSFYIGSTPNPRRRLNQHNGDKRLGAVRTRRIQPWTMVGAVTGFPSQVAALQFEWAWQNAHLTRHLSQEHRMMFRGAMKKDGNARKPRQLGQTSLSRRLKKLNLLLQSRSFDRLLLEVRFFARQALDAWEALEAKAADRTAGNVKVSLDERGFEFQTEPKPQPPASEEADGHLRIGEPVGIDAIDVKYVSLRPHLQKSLALLQASPVSCAVCRSTMDNEGNLILVCPESDCNMASHLTCLSKKFLDAEGRTDSVLPLKGECPCCNRSIAWSDLMRELSMRTRGRSELMKLTNKNTRKLKAKDSTVDAGSAVIGLPYGNASEEAQSIISIVLDESEGDDEEDDEHSEGLEKRDGETLSIANEEHMISISSDKVEDSTGSRLADMRALPPEIPDSDWDETENVVD